ncbi:MAG: hypothetical protein ABI536_08935 [Gallionella sp.]
MQKMEEKEMDAYRDELNTDIRNLVRKYRRIFDWDIPEVDQQAADKLILGEMQAVLQEISAKSVAYHP